jgi:site-specific DNA recombinase
MNTWEEINGQVGSQAAGTPCFAYVRVSTAKQREHSVSLEAQREAIERYAARNGLVITEWFSESQTAAKRGRKEFNRIIRLLRQGKARGVIVHKIDRSARNLKDWADFAELTDRGVAVHFAAEALDLSSRGGRLSADIQAVVAADYIRNLRQEAVKGIRGRLRQGLFPGRAPLGYLDNGSGKVKTIDPVRGPLVRDLFERYATGRYSLEALVTLMTKKGLTNTTGGAITKNTLSKVLNNPFYTGLIVVKSTGETYEGKHEPLITRALFEAVQANLRGYRRRKGCHQHDYTFRKLLKCGLCGYTLIAERQKGFVYYRCHTPVCPLKCTREEEVERAISDAISRMSLSDVEYETYLRTLEVVTCRQGSRIDEEREALEIELAKANERLSRLADLLLDGVFSDEDYHAKKRSLLERKQRLSEAIATLAANPGAREQKVRRYLERAKRASLSYERASTLRKREMVETFTSNREVTPENVVVELQEPYQTLANREVVCEGGPLRDVHRTHQSRPTTKNPRLSLIHSMLEQAEEEVKRQEAAGDGRM